MTNEGEALRGVAFWFGLATLALMVAIVRSLEGQSAVQAVVVSSVCLLAGTAYFFWLRRMRASIALANGTSTR